MSMKAAKIRALREEIDHYSAIVEQTERDARSVRTQYQRSVAYNRLEGYTRHLDSLTYELDVLIEAIE